MLKKYENAIVRLSKLAQKQNKISRPALAGAYYKDNKTYICHGFWGVVFKEELKIDGLAMAQDSASRPNWEIFISNNKTEFKFDIEELKSTELVKINDEYLIDTKLVKNIMSCFKEVKFYTTDKNMMYFESDNAYGLICYIRRIK